MKKKKQLHKRIARKNVRTHSLSSRPYFYSTIGVIGVIVILGFAQTLVQGASLQFDSPKLLSQTNVLGEGDVSDQAKQQEEADKKAQEQLKEDIKNAEEQQNEAAKSSNSGSGTSGSSMNTQNSGNKKETEIETTVGLKIKTKIEDNGTTKIEIEHGELKIKYVLENGQLVKKVENDDGDEVELEDDELEEVENEIENELEDDGIEISTSSGKPIVIKNHVAASTEFPLSIDVGTNQLILTTSEGQKVLTVLPDQAVQNLLATGIINSVNAIQASDISTTSTLGPVDSVVQLKVRNSEPIYEIDGTKIFRLFAVIPVSQPVKAIVSAETGELVTKQQSFFTNVIDLLSP